MIFSIQWHNYDVNIMKNKALFSFITKISSMASKNYDIGLQRIFEDLPQGYP